MTDVAAAPVAMKQRAALARPVGVVGRRSILNALFVLPYFIVFLVLMVVPLGVGIWLSFQDYDMLGGYGGPVGLANFTDLFNDKTFRQAVLNTFYFVLLSVPGFVVLGLFLALALNDTYRRSAVLRSIFFGSSVLSVTIVTLIWRLVYMPERGMLAAATNALGLPSVSFMTTETLAMPGIAIVTVWWIIGLPMMLFLAALQQIPREVYEAAALDNASRWRTLTRITLPSIRRTIVLVARDRADPAIPDLRADPPDHQWRAQQLDPSDRDVHLRGRVPRLGAGLRSGRLAGALRPHAGGVLLPDLDRPFKAGGLIMRNLHPGTLRTTASSSRP